MILADAEVDMAGEDSLSADLCGLRRPSCGTAVGVSQLVAKFWVLVVLDAGSITFLS